MCRKLKSRPPCESEGLRIGGRRRFRALSVFTEPAERLEVSAERVVCRSIFAGGWPALGPRAVQDQQQPVMKEICEGSQARIVARPQALASELGKVMRQWSVGAK